ncbi:hypothetical protein PHYSODRAFT_488752 [Phytophthora sojae]|uniref:Uncharacterized protein n=1 Tax=Phytophthora sojae (strain P6497) TaxID=1094619 RepID=G4Z2W4_PHYSP|nr:hypothetical protein PHYSODRAFT_488752 [Phytophthora sojae]EGZ19297.1 hypothetical protein PHYSODRAFT_488752 [Phytophthora sojae]|eukprot:XP_009522014.1 hypothetical protein PHYSODRAFT_488752 [Phytophthora sojae]
MVDSLVDAVQAASPPIGLSIRSENEYIDRLHQFLLPTWFTNINWRTNQALYYPPALLATMSARSICFPANGNRTQIPPFCSELWINFDKSCAPADVKGRAVGLLYVHTMARLREVEARFPHLAVDLTFLESQEDLQVSRGGLSWTGFRRSDVSTVIRARKCINIDVPSSCETVYLEDYRYETGLLISDIVQWYRLLAALRIVGQGYFLLRGIGLMLSCYFVHGTPKS